MEQEEATGVCGQWISKENLATSGRATVLLEMWSRDHPHRWALSLPRSIYHQKDGVGSMCVRESSVGPCRAFLNILLKQWDL